LLPGEVLIVDEADKLLFENPKTFLKLTQGNPAICFTATASSIDKNGFEKLLLDSLNLKVCDSATALEQ